MEASLENQMKNLQAKWKSHESNGRDIFGNKDLTINAICSPLHGPKMRPRGFESTPPRKRRELNLPVCTSMPSNDKDNTEVENKMKEIMQRNGILNISGTEYRTDIKDLEHLGELGNGTCGHVVKMRHKPSDTIVAVKQMRRSGNSDENKRIIMDLDVVFKSLDCPYIVRYLGCFITDSDVWICMELMATCFDRLLKKLQAAVPEDILGKVALATVKALHYLKESHGVIHRDVKPSNILLDEKGNVKLCDFGISGRLVDSKARTKNAGCAAYMAPERIEPPDPRKPDYDIRADVWSLGITLVELATGIFPYKDCKCDFEVLSRVLKEDPPSLPRDPQRFTPEFQSFVSACLTKDYCQRPKYRKLLEHPFLKKYENKAVDVAAWYAIEIDRSCPTIPLRFTATSLSSSTRRQPPPPPQSNHQSRRTTGLENIVLNGDQSSGLFSPFRFINSQYGLNGLHLNEWESHKYSMNKHSGVPSPLVRRCVQPEPSYMTNDDGSYSNNCGSELVMQQFCHQQNHHFGNHIPSYPMQSSHYRSTSLSPSRRYAFDSNKLMGDARKTSISSEDSTHESPGLKKRFASYFKYQIGDDNVMDNIYRRSPPTVPSPAPPSPPPRLNRFSSNGSSAFLSSPMMMKRSMFENSESPIAGRKTFVENSHIMPRRHYTPPQPPPRRWLESNSVPSSPQHLSYRRNDIFRNTPALGKLQYTPQPQRKTIYQINDL